MKALRTLHPLVWFCLATALLWLITVLVPLVHPAWGYAGYPYFIQSEAFTDLTIFARQFQHFRQPTFYTASDFPLTYPAFTGILIATLLATGHGVRAFSALVVLATLIGLGCTATALVRRGLSVVTAFGLMLYVGLTSFPLCFDLSRANMEFFSALFVALGIALCWRKYWQTGAVFLGLAIACKLYPVILLGFLVAQRKYRATLVALVSAAIANVAALAVLGPTIAEAHRQVSRGLAYFDTEYVVLLLRGASAFDHSIFGIYKLLTYHLLHHGPDYRQDSRVYLLLAIGSAVVLYLVRIIRLPAANQIVLLTTLGVLLPPVSYDYTLLGLYVAWVVLAFQSLRVPAGSRQRLPLAVSFLCLAWALSPETFLRSGTGLTKCVALLLLVVVQCRYPLPRADEPRFHLLPGELLPA